MTIKAKLNYLRISPRKTRLVADLIRGKSVLEAQAILNFIVKKSKEPFLKLLNQAVSNAQNSFQLDEKNLYISKITVDEGPKLKRWRPRSRGQAYEIQKKTSHISIVLDQIVAKPIKKKKKQDKTEKKEQEKVSSASRNLENDKTEKTDKIKLRPEKETLVKPKPEKGIKKIFKRKAF
jgi:large subunit ribosomal protein L22